MSDDMMSLITHFLVCSSAVFSAFAASLRADDKADAKHLDFFEKKIRPVLVKHCYACHSAKSKSVKGKLLLDSRDAIRKGGESGPAVVPGDVKKSLLIDAIKYESFEMPPKQRLPKTVIADFETWIKNGAHDPRESKAGGQRPAGSRINLAAGRKFWAFQPLKRHPAPDVKNGDWPTSDIDRFILKRLEAAGLKPAADADRRTWIRRVTYDLTGLPPTPRESQRFLSDKSPNAYAKVVDRLLASPRFGEHWGRHWLDIARYADSNGGDINLTFKNAWRYRDYVVRSFNSDKPYDRFIVEQIAGDLVPPPSHGGARGSRAEAMIASGFLIVGSKMLSERDKEKLRMDTVDEQLDTIGRAFLGLTLGCARCHDHKFDPIPTSDYYALAGILRSTVTVQGIRMNNVNVSGWIERKLPIPPEQQAAVAEHQRKTATLQSRITALRKRLGLTAATGIVKAKNLPGIVVDDMQATTVGLWKKSKYTKRFVGAGYVHDDKQGKGKKSITFTPNLPTAGRYEVRLSWTGGNGRAANVPVTIRHADGMSNKKLNQRKQPTIGRLFGRLGVFRFEAGRKGSVTISNAGTTGHVIADAVQFLPVDAKPVTTRKPASKKDANLEQQLATLESQLNRLKKTAPPQAPMCMAPSDRPQPADCHIRIRGEAKNKGKLVPRGYLSVLPLDGPKIANGQSGRLELAQWIADRRNPLTARVIVNRIWHHLFGAGIVRSVDNFGKLGDRPSHPQLLDRLAVEFVENGNSLKTTIRKIVLSRTYRMSSAHSDSGMAQDPQNRLLWRHNRRRLTAEAIRDSILAVSGRLDQQLGGSAVTNFGEQAVANNLRHKGGGTSSTATRRSLYLPLVRNDLPKILTVFDFADPNVTTGARNVTTVPAQALLMMNSEFVKSHAADLAKHLQAETDDDKRLTRLYELVLNRRPTTLERQRAEKYLAGFDAATSEESQHAWSSYCHALLASTEFRFVE